MSHTNNHLSDGDLIMALDGELNPRRKAEATAHLECCWQCRERKLGIENTISEFVRARNQGIESAIPDGAGARALLRARLAGEARKQTTYQTRMPRRLDRSRWPEVCRSTRAEAVSDISEGTKARVFALSTTASARSGPTSSSGTT